MTALRGCPYCSGFMHWGAYACNECNGTNSRISYSDRTRALAECMRAAAIEEMRLRHTVAAVRDTWSLP